jgi:hypothetical protein
VRKSGRGFNARRWSKEVREQAQPVDSLKVVASGSSVARTTTFSHDWSTGLPLSAVDSDNNIGHVYGYDSLGRQILDQESAGNTALRKTTTQYEDGNRRVVVKRDKDSLALV